MPEFTTITYPGQKMGKEYRVSASGEVEAVTDGAGHEGWFKVENPDGLPELNSILDGYELSQIMVHGVPPDARQGYVHSGVPSPHVDLTEIYDIQRTKEALPEPEGLGFCTSDSDFDHAPYWTKYIQTPPQLYNFFTAVVPELRGVGTLVRPSGSNGIIRPNGTPYKSTRNFHTHFICEGHERIELLERLHGLFAVRGYAWIMIGQSGGLLERSPVDLALRTPNQPVFAARPRVIAPVGIQRPEAFVAEGRVLRLADLPEPEGVAEAYERLKTCDDLLQRREQTKNRYQKQKAREVLALTPNPTRQQAKTVLKQQRVQAAEREAAWAGQPLGPDFIIHTKQYGPLTVQQLLDHPTRYHEAKTCDPMEPEYRNYAQTGILYLTGKVQMCVSLAHGQTKKYSLRGHLPFDLDKLLAEPKALTPAKPEETEKSLEVGMCYVVETISGWYLAPRTLGLRATPGSGKTFAAMRCLVEADPMGYTLYLAPMIKTCEEAFKVYEDYGGTDGMIFYGRGQPDLEIPGKKMCTNPKHVAKGLAFGTERNLCEGCPIRGKGECGYDRQVKRLQKEQPKLVLASHSFAFFPLPGWEPDRVIIDEALPPGGVDMEISTDALAIASLQHHPEGAAKALQRHLKTLPDFSDYDKVKAHRYKTLVLEAIEKGERVVWFGGKAILPEIRPYRYKGLPLLMLDGTLRRSLAERVVGTLSEVVHIDIFRHLRVVQVVGKLFSNASICKPGVMQDDVKLMEVDFDLVLTTKKVREALGWNDDRRYAHLGASRGINELEDAKTAFAVLYGQPNMAAMIALAEVIQGEPVEGEEVEQTLYIKMRDGRWIPTVVHGHTDELVTELIRHYREDQILQLVDRLRAVRARAGEKSLLLCCPVALDLWVDEAIDFSDVRPTRYDKILLKALSEGSGVVPASPRQAVRFRPDIWKSLATARRHYKAWGSAWHTNLEEVILQERDGDTKRVVGYKLKNWGGQKRIL